MKSLVIKKTTPDMLSWSIPDVKHELLPLKVQYKASLVGCTSHPFIIHYLIFVTRNQFDSFMGLSIIWKAFCSYQVKKKKQPNEKKQKPSKCLEMALRLHFVRAQIYCWRSSVTTFLTCHIQYLPLFTRESEFKR